MADGQVSVEGGVEGVDGFVAGGDARVGVEAGDAGVVRGGGAEEGGYLGCYLCLGTGGWGDAGCDAGD